MKLQSIRVIRLLALPLLLAGLLATKQPAHADQITDDNAIEKSANAATAAEHEALATYYRGKADAAGKEAESHEKMLAKLGGGKNYFKMSPHCRMLIRANQEEQKSYEDLATMHNELAKEAGK